MSKFFTHLYDECINSEADVETALEFVTSHYTREDIENCVVDVLFRRFPNATSSTIFEHFPFGIYGFIFSVICGSGQLNHLNEFERRCMEYYGLSKSDCPEIKGPEHNPYLR